jgi:cytidine deaminase
LENGTIVTGTNQENAAYPSGMCAERVALFAMASQYPKATIKKMAVVAMPVLGKSVVPATSCGSCRQVMLEYETRQSDPFEIVMLNEDHVWVTATSARALLPFCFTGKNLKAGKHD